MTKQEITKLKKQIIIIFIVIALIVTGTSILLLKTNYSDGIASFLSFEKSSKSNKVRIAYLPVVQALPLYLAIEKGYFKEAGIEVEAIKLDSPNLIIDALLSGQVDFGAPGTASGITAVADHQRPDELKIFALIGGNDSTTNDVLIVRKDSQIKSIIDLKSKKLGILPGIQFRTIAKHILAQNGLSTERDVIIVELAPALQVQALASKQVDALLTIEPLGTIARVKGVGKELIHAPMVQYISNPWYGAVGVVRTRYVEENPETTTKILQVFNRAINEINQNPKYVKRYLKGYTALDEQLIDEVPLPIFKMYPDFTKSDIDSLQEFFDIFTRYSVIDGKVSAEELVYSKR